MSGVPVGLKVLPPPPSGEKVGRLNGCNVGNGGEGTTGARVIDGVGNDVALTGTTVGRGIIGSVGAGEAVGKSEVGPNVVVGWNVSGPGAGVGTRVGKGAGV